MVVTDVVVAAASPSPPPQLAGATSPHPQSPPPSLLSALPDATTPHHLPPQLPPPRCHLHHHRRRPPPPLPAAAAEAALRAAQKGERTKKRARRGLVNSTRKKRQFSGGGRWRRGCACCKVTDKENGKQPQSSGHEARRAQRACCLMNACFCFSRCCSAAVARFALRSDVRSLPALVSACKQTKDRRGADVCDWIRSVFVTPEPWNTCGNRPESDQIMGYPHLELADDLSLIPPPVLIRPLL